MKNLINKFLHSNKKSKTLINNVIISFGIKGLGLVLALFTMPSYIKFFNNETVLGVWFTALSILNWVLTFDFGISNGLRNLLVKPLSEKNNKEIKTYVSSTYVSIVIITVVFLIIGIIIFPNINWNAVYNIKSSVINNNVLYFMTQVLFIGIILNFIFNIINSIFYAMQQSFVPSLLNLISTVLILIFINLFPSNNIINNIKNLSIINVLFSNLPLLIATIIVFKTKLKSCAPNIKFFKKKYAKKIINLGIVFFGLQILTMLMYGFNEFLITNLSSPKDVVNYQIYNKLFSLISTLFNLAITPVWSAVRESCVEKDYNWIKKIHKYINLSFILIIFIECMLILCLQFILDVLLGKNYITINYMYAIIFAISTLFQMKMSVDASFSNGMGYLKLQIIGMLITTMLKFILSIVLTKIFNDWIWVIGATAISIIPFIIIEHFDFKNQLKLMEDNDVKK